MARVRKQSVTCKETTSTGESRNAGKWAVKHNIGLEVPDTIIDEATRLKEVQPSCSNYNATELATVLLLKIKIYILIEIYKNWVYTRLAFKHIRRQ